MELQQKAKILVDFINFCKESMEITKLPKINFIKNRSWVVQNRTFGQYINEQQSLVVYIGNRNLADICRTLAHELCHHRQNELGMLDSHSGETGSPIENEAHEVAGIIMREYGKVQPLIYENKNIFLEVIDLYNIDNFPKGVEINITSESPKKFFVTIIYKNTKYKLTVLPTNPIEVIFGLVDENNELDSIKLTNSPYSPLILACIFSLLKYWLDKYNIEEFFYKVDGNMRYKLYDLYLKKHFREYNLEGVKEFGTLKYVVWKKK